MLLFIWQDCALRFNMDTKEITLLSDMMAGSRCVIVKVNGHGGLRHRLMEMGFVRGETVRVLKNAPLMDPVEYMIMDAHVSLRKSEAKKIEVVAVSETTNMSDNFNGMMEDIIVNDKNKSEEIKEKSNDIRVALLGNPNCGKTSFFNQATGQHQKVGNYAGVTVDIKEGVFYHNGYTIHLIDLPGSYSVPDYSPGERFVREFITQGDFDIVLNIVDASNLERNLFLTTQLIDMNVRIVMALNMYDELQNKGDKLDHKALGKLLGMPIIPTTASQGKGIADVLQSIIDVFEDRKNLTKHIHINYGNDIEDAIAPVKKLIEQNADIINIYPARYLAITALEENQPTKDVIEQLHNGEQILSLSKHLHENLERDYHEDMTEIFADARYAFIRGALRETYIRNEQGNERLAYSVDKILTNRWLGFPILIIFLFVMFDLTFILGAYPQDWIEAGVDWLGESVRTLMPAGMLNDLLVDGVIAGAGGVIVFLPNIILLFFFISILEDTGYMARAAFIMDRLMHRLGLHGKSFIPFIMGFGCAVPAIMATRTLENRKDRIVTILSTPFMSCSARLPVYLIFVSAFFPHHQGLVMLSVYLIGVIVAILTSFLLNRTMFKGLSEQFVMELPPYRIPTSRNIFIHMWDKSVQYLKKMGTVILAASIIIWALEYFPRTNATTELIAQQIEQTQDAATTQQLELKMSAAQREGSYIGQFGHFIEPVMRPIGFDWRLGVSLCTGIAAKEVVVSTLSVLLEVEETDDNKAIEDHLHTMTWTDGAQVDKPIFDMKTAYSFMLFVLLSTPCFATLTAIRREAGGMRYAIFTLLYNTTLAWIVSFLIHVL